MPNSLTRTAGLKLGPIVLDTLFKHYFDRVKKSEKAEHVDVPFTQLRQDELLYDEAFNVVQRFLGVAVHHSIEELQGFANTRIAIPPSVHVVRVTVPMSCCDEAATLLIQALGGEEHTSSLVGGTKWWQVRGAIGIPAEWVAAKKDWEGVKKHRKTSGSAKSSNSGSPQEKASPLPSSTSEPSDFNGTDADNLRCILFAHGGGYYFGSIDQERHCMQRLSRKIKGRVFTVNYRLAPQYPFPCALQDLIAAYLYLIRPPPGAPHRPVDPSRIVVAGGSAGGGLCIALLQVLRDVGQPLPAGGILISPWCDLTHSFPSILTNMDTDVFPAYGVSFHKPSTLWPPPSEEMTRKIHTEIRQKVQQIARATADEGAESASRVIPIDIEATASLPSINGKGETVSLQAKSGERLETDSQIHFYTQNSLLGHPLVSPVRSYLGGLPPLLIVVSDKEVLRDEDIYLAHKAAYPSQFPLKDEAIALYPPLVGIGERYGPTQVHLQVYDDTAHILPILFPFTTPAKYCHRAIATFTKHVTGTLLPRSPATGSPEAPASSPQHPVGDHDDKDASTQQPSRLLSSDDVVESLHILDGPDVRIPKSDLSSPRPLSSRSVFSSFGKKSARAPMSRAISTPSFRRRTSRSPRSQQDRSTGSPRTANEATAVRCAGEASVYYDKEGCLTWTGGMIRERVSTRGIIRPLEPNDELDAMRMPPESIGVVSEDALRRYIEGKTLFDRKYAKEVLTVEKKRLQNLELAKREIAGNFARLHELQKGRAPGAQRVSSRTFMEELESPSGAWGWAFADERPPASSIVSRRDTEESRRLVRIACRAFLQTDGQMNGSNLWDVIVKLLAPSPPKIRRASDTETAVESPVARKAVKKSKSVLTSLRTCEAKQKG